MVSGGATPNPLLPDATSSFATTHWSVVMAAGGNDSLSTQAALAALCQTYWYPLYAHIRRRGYDADAARDLTQGFFAQAIASGSLGKADSSRGRFRTFVLTVLDHFLHHQHRDAQALKRGGSTEIVSWDVEDAEHRYTLEARDDRSPDREFDRRWALATLETARGHLRKELSIGGKAELFDLLRPHLCADLDAVPYAQIATQLKMTTVAVKVTVHRLRRRYGELLRQEVAHTLADSADVEQEIRHLIAALSD